MCSFRIYPMEIFHIILNYFHHSTYHFLVFPYLFTVSPSHPIRIPAHWGQGYLSGLFNTEFSESGRCAKYLLNEWVRNCTRSFTIELAFFTYLHVLRSFRVSACGSVCFIFSWQLPPLCLCTSWECDCTGNNSLSLSTYVVPGPVHFLFESIQPHISNSILIFQMRKTEAKEGCTARKWQSFESLFP